MPYGTCSTPFSVCSISGRYGTGNARSWLRTTRTSRTHSKNDGYGVSGTGYNTSLGRNGSGRYYASFGGPPRTVTYTSATGNTYLAWRNSRTTAPYCGGYSTSFFYRS